MIEAEGLTRTYGQFLAVDAVSFSVSRGEVVGLLGHNGAGKSTVMKMITGYMEPTDGTVRIAGTDIAKDRRSVQARIGYLPENCPVWPEMTVIDYLSYHAALRGFSSVQIESVVARAIRRTMLAEKAMDRIETLSRGYRQRVGVAQAILHDPDIVILDEPTNGLDPTQVRGMRSLVKELAQRSTVLISTHVLHEVRAVCQRVLIMRAGKLVLDRHLDSLYQEAQGRIKVTAGSDLSSMISQIPGVQLLGIVGDECGRFVHDIQTTEDLIPRVVAAIDREGASLYAVEPQKKDLEAVFSEISEGDGHVA